MIYFWELADDSDEYDRFGKMTDDGEILEGEDRLLSIYPEEMWQDSEPDEILASFNNGRIMASHEESDDVTPDAPAA